MNNNNSSDSVDMLAMSLEAFVNEKWRSIESLYFEVTSWIQ